MKTNTKVYKKVTIKIGNLKWIVNLCDKNNKYLFDKDKETSKYKDDIDIDEGAFGITIFERNEIYVHKEMTLQMIKRTIIHELTHAFLFTFGMMADNPSLDEERICTFNEEHIEDILNAANTIHREFKNFVKVN